jgi:hypothetical protein
VVGSASLGVSLPVDPGHHVMVVSAPGRRDRRYEVVIAEGDEKVIAVSSGEQLPAPNSPPNALLVSESPPPVPQTEHRAFVSDGSFQHGAMFVSAGVGIACIVTGGIFGVVALTSLASANAACVGDVCSTPAAVSQYREAQSFALATDVTVGVGIALIATAVVLAVTSPARHRSGGRSGVSRWIEGRF